jgi:uncharacterized membrane protein
MDSRQRGERSNQRMAGVVHKNIASLVEMRKAEERKKGLQEKTADLLTKFSGSMTFVIVHTIWFVVWIALNTGLLGTKPFDPFPFSLLTLVVSLEAIFLSTFVLISQNHAGQVAEKRAELDLQINLLAEHEITRLLTMMDAVAEHLGVEIPEKPEVQELKEDVGAEEVLGEIEKGEKAEKVRN